MCGHIKAGLVGSSVERETISKHRTGKSGTHATTASQGEIG